MMSGQLFHCPFKADFKNQLVELMSTLKSYHYHCNAAVLLAVILLLLLGHRRHFVNLLSLQSLLVTLRCVNVYMLGVSMPVM